MDDEAQALQPLVSATHNHTFPASLPQFNNTSQDASPAAGTPSEAPSAEQQPEVEAMTTQEALRIYAPQQKIREKIIADFKKGLNPEEIASKHEVAQGTVQTVIKRHQHLETMTLSKSTRYRRKKKADAEEAARKANQVLEPGESCGEFDFVRMKNQGQCVACTVKFQKVALGKVDKASASSRRARTQHGCRNCKVHLCRRGYCWDVFHNHAKT